MITMRKSPPYRHIAAVLGQSVRPRCQSQGLEAVLRGEAGRRDPRPLPSGLLLPGRQDHLYVVLRLQVDLQLHTQRELAPALRAVPVLLLGLHDVLVAGVPVDHLDQPRHWSPQQVLHGKVWSRDELFVVASHVLLEVPRVLERSITLLADICLARVSIVHSVSWRKDKELR